MSDFKLNFKTLDINVLCIEGSDTEVNYNIQLLNIAYFFFRQENDDTAKDILANEFLCG